MMQRIVCVIALFCCVSSGFSQGLKKRFFLDSIPHFNPGEFEKHVDEDCISCTCSGDCRFDEFTKNACQVLTSMTDCSNDKCQHNTCSGHGHCYAVQNTGRMCTCTDGYIGIHCDQKQVAVTTPVDNCAISPCQHGQCSSTAGGYVCTCTAGWEGTNCETSTTPLLTPAPDLCANNPCINGQCTNSAGVYLCTCTAGWKGTNCDTSTAPLFTPAPDLCANNPCGAHGQCTNDASGYHCACVAGWSGQNCEIDIDQCNSSPCKNNGTCLDLGSFVTCACADGWSGTRCEKDATPSCKHLCVLEPVATVHSVFNDAALKCNDVNLGSNQAIPMTCCGLGPEDTWLKGIQVITHCSGASALPTYTPIASFKSGRPANDTSGVFVGCDANGFKYIRQTCGSTPHVIIVDGSNGFDPSSFYVIY